MAPVSNKGGATMGEQLASKGQDSEAAKVITLPEHTIGAIFGSPIFERPERLTPTKNGKSMLVARVRIPVCGLFSIGANVWDAPREAEGYIEHDFSLSFVRDAVNLLRDRPDVAEELDTWRAAVMCDGGPFDKFIDPTAAGTVNIKAGGARLVKRQAVAVKK